MATARRSHYHMGRSPQVVALCGSRRDASKTRIAARTALAAAADAGARTTLLDRREYHLPAFDPDRGDVGDAPALREVVAGADAILLATPNYHGSYSGVLKNALDYLGRDEFAGKPVGLIEVAGGSVPKPALAHLRGVCRTLNAWPLPLEVGIPESSETVGSERVEDDALRDRLRRLGRETVAYAGVENYPDLADRRVAARADP